MLVWPNRIWICAYGGPRTYMSSVEDENLDRIWTVIRCQRFKFSLNSFERILAKTELAQVMAQV